MERILGRGAVAAVLVGLVAVERGPKADEDAWVDPPIEGLTLVAAGVVGLPFREATTELPGLRTLVVELIEEAADTLPELAAAPLSLELPGRDGVIAGCLLGDEAVDAAAVRLAMAADGATGARLAEVEAEADEAADVRDTSEGLDVDLEEDVEPTEGF